MTILNLDANDTDSDEVVIEATQILSAVTTFTTLTSNSDLVDVDGAGGAIADVIPDVFNVIEIFVADNVNDTENEGDIGDQVVALAESTLNLFINLELSLDDDNFNDTNDTAVEARNDLAQKLADYDTFAIKIALTVQITGVQYTYTNDVYDDDGNLVNRKRAGGRRYNPRGGGRNDVRIGRESCQLPANIGDDLGNDQDLDITMSSSRRSRFRSRDKGYKAKSGTVTINVYSSNGGDDRRRARARARARRRLQENTDPTEDDKFVFNASSCFPYLISIDITHDTVVETTNNDEWGLDEVGVFPQCRFWNGSVAEWDPEGCIVFEINNVVICMYTFNNISSDCGGFRA